MLTKQHEIFFQTLRDFISPKPHLEQYPTPPSLAIKFLNMAKMDIENKVVVDLGCGTGILSIGASLLNAKLVIGVDIDYDSLRIAKMNLEYSKKMFPNIDVILVCADVKRFNFNADTVIMNPPFGMQKKGADRIFLECAMKGAKVIWTLLGHDSDPFISRLAKNYGFFMENKGSYEFPIKSIMKFHKRRVYRTKVSIYRLFRL